MSRYFSLYKIIYYFINYFLEEVFFVELVEAFVELVETFEEQDFVELFLEELHLQEPYN